MSDNIHELDEEEKESNVERIKREFKKNPINGYKLYKDEIEGKGQHCIFCEICNKCCCCKCEAEVFGMEYCSRFGGVGSGIYKNYGYLTAKAASVFRKMTIKKINNCEHCEHNINNHRYITHPEGEDYVNL